MTLTDEKIKYLKAWLATKPSKPWKVKGSKSYQPLVPNEARDKLTAIYYPLFYHIALKYYGRSTQYTSVDPLISYAYEGFLRALDKATPERIETFDKYVGEKIEFGIIDGMRKERGVRSCVKYATDAREKIYSAVSLDALLEDEEGTYQPEAPFVNLLEYSETADELEKLLDGEDERERYIVRRYFCDNVSLAVIAKELGRSESRISQIFKAVLQRIRIRLGVNYKRLPRQSDLRKANKLLARQKITLDK